MEPKFSLLALVLANLLLPIGFLVFSSGFFPHKTLLPGSAQFSVAHQAKKITTAPFDKVIFMVVDALRSDFVYSPDSGFTFVQSLIRDGAALPFTSRATSPTITMPRIKALTTGSTPSFLDVIFNFAETETATSLTNQDNWLSQLKKLDRGNLVMYGDDTWLHLFPDMFDRADGTSSFFVSDFTEVDNNVTRHIPQELQNSDWSGMVLHFLGLDHIGHKSGPQSAHMRPKQEEMDAVVKQLYGGIEQYAHLDSTVLVLCGDHGMNDAGNHGGSSAGEMSPALVFISPKFMSISNGTDSPARALDSAFGFYGNVEQADIVPTLAGLLGFPVPLNNLGVFIQDLLPLWPEETQISLLLDNAWQMLQISRDSLDDSLQRPMVSGKDRPKRRSEDGQLEDLWAAVESVVGKDLGSYLHQKQAIYSFANHAQENLARAASKYNLKRLLSGIMIMIGSFSMVAPGLVSRRSFPGSFVLWALFSVTANSIMMFGSSYVEEEHHFWYWLTSSWIFWLFICQQRNPHLEHQFVPGTVGLLAISSFRLLRAWNQTGQKYAGEAGIARQFLPSNNVFLWSLVLGAYGVTIAKLCCAGFLSLPRWIATLLYLLIGMVAISFKITFVAADSPELLLGIGPLIYLCADQEALIWQARVVFIPIVVFFLALATGFSSIAASAVSRRRIWGQSHHIMTLFLLTQTRITNIPLFILLYILEICILKLSATPQEKILLVLFLQYSSFFAFGGSNAISSIDLSNAYNGVSGYNAVVVGILTFFSNWAGPLWWTSAILPLIKSRQQQVFNFPAIYFSTSTCLVAANASAVMLACFAMRTHLFIWTVFSPKYLYTLGWSLCQHIIINICYLQVLYGATVEEPYETIK